MNMNMKNIWLKSALMAVAGFTAVSCGDFLEITPMDTVVEDNYWDEKNDVDMIVTGCYTRMQDVDFLSRAFVWGEVRADNVSGLNTKSGEDEYEILVENIISTNSYTAWSPFYAVINRCNLVIDRAPKVAAIDPDYSDSEVRMTIAEVTGLRALCYFYLVRTFGDVPYYTYAITGDDQDLTLPVTNGNQILDELIADLESVQGYAPLSFLNGNTDITCGRMSRTAIWALLADICLWRGQYDKAITYADMVIAYKNRYNPYSSEYDLSLSSSSSSSMYSSANYLRQSYFAGKDVDGNDKYVYYPLLDDASSTSSTGSFGSAYTAIFGGDGMSRESIFELCFDEESASGTGKNNVMIDLFFHRYVERSSSEKIADGKFKAAETFVMQYNSDQMTSSVGPFLPWVSQSDLNAMPTPDARFLESIYYGTSGVAVEKGAAATGELVKYNFNSYTATPKGGNSSTKTYQLYSPRQKKTRNGANWIFYRVSDMMLIKAEALAYAYPDDEERLQEAFYLVKAINDRSNTDRDGSGNITSVLKFESYKTPTMLKILILDERRREFLFEGKRWFDLVRWSIKENERTTIYTAAVSKMQGASAGSGKLKTAEGSLYFPYNKTELETNPNLHQNPAYPEVDDNSNYESTN